MAWSSVHRGDYTRMRRHLTIALLEAEALEPRVQLAYARGEISDSVTAKCGLIRLLLQRADEITRAALDRELATYHEVYADSTFTDRALAESA